MAPVSDDDAKEQIIPFGPVWQTDRMTGAPVKEAASHHTAQGQW